MESLLLFTMSHTIPALKCHTYTDHMWDMAKWTNMAAAAVKIYFWLSINFFFKSYLNNTRLTSMWTTILALHLYEITRRKPNSPIIISCCAPYNLGQKRHTAKAHTEVLKNSSTLEYSILRVYILQATGPHDHLLQSLVSPCLKLVTVTWHSRNFVYIT